MEVSQSEEGLHFNSANFTTNAIHMKIIYDGLGRVVKATNPYRNASASTDGWERTTYDVEGRVTEVATFSGSYLIPPPDFPQTNASNTGSVVTEYDGEKTKVRDQAVPASSFFAGGASGDTANRLQYTAHGAVSVMKMGNGL